MNVMIEFDNGEGSGVSVTDVLIEREGKPPEPGVMFETNGSDNTLSYDDVVKLLNTLGTWTFDNHPAGREAAKRMKDGPQA